MSRRNSPSPELLRELVALRAYQQQRADADSVAGESGELGEPPGAGLQGMIDALADPITVVDARTHHVVLANRAARTLAGVSTELQPGLCCYELLHHRDQPCDGGDEPCPLLTVKRTRDAYRVTHLHRDAQGEAQYVDVLATPVFDADGEVGWIVESTRDMTAWHRLQAEREQLITELEAALAKIKTLSGLVPICAWCHRIRDDAGFWEELETYLHAHTNADFTHGICPGCVDKVRRESGVESSQEP